MLIYHYAIVLLNCSLHVGIPNRNRSTLLGNLEQHSAEQVIKTEKEDPLLANVVTTHAGEQLGVVGSFEGTMMGKSKIIFKISHNCQQILPAMCSPNSMFCAQMSQGLPIQARHWLAWQLLCLPSDRQKSTKQLPRGRKPNCKTQQRAKKRRRVSRI